MLPLAVGITPTLHANATVGCAARPQRRSRALSVFVALVTYEAIVVAAVCGRRAICLRLASQQAMIDERIAGVAAWTICCSDASNAAVSVIAMNRTRRLTIGVLGALVAFAFDAVQIGRALSVNAAALARRRHPGDTWLRPGRP